MSEFEDDEGHLLHVVVAEMLCHLPPRLAVWTIIRQMDLPHLDLFENATYRHFGLQNLPSLKLTASLPLEMDG